jgi:hypothetical protein
MLPPALCELLYECEEDEVRCLPVLEPTRPLGYCLSLAEASLLVHIRLCLARSVCPPAVPGENWSLLHSSLLITNRPVIGGITLTCSWTLLRDLLTHSSLNPLLGLDGEVLRGPLRDGVQSEWVLRLRLPRLIVASGTTKSVAAACKM